MAWISSDLRLQACLKEIYVWIGVSVAQLFEVMLHDLGCQKEMVSKCRTDVEPNPKDLPFLKELLDTGKVVPIIDKPFSMREVPDALRYFGEIHTKGKIVITVEQKNVKYTQPNN